ncbi:MAG: hypothetical protein ACJ8GN_23510 [Longimicrobiaceae bacterium]
MLMHMHRLAILAVGLALGCRDLPTASAPAPLPAAPAAPQAALRCVASVGDRTVQCGPATAPRGARVNLTLGGQGLHVRLTTTHVSFDGASRVLSADVAVQNLLDQPMGTDGSAVTGLRVFFASGPTATSGSGAVTVLADSVGTFLATGQPYYKYDGVLEPRAVSSPRTWAFSVDPGVTTFEFQVYVDTRTPGETGILHWRPEWGAPVRWGDFRGVWAASPHDVFAVGNGVVLHFDGNYWRAMDAGGADLNGVWGLGGTNVYAVGSAGTVLHWTGGAWVPEFDVDLGTADLRSVWGFSANDVWVVGDSGRIAHFDGSGWTAHEVTAKGLRSVWGNAANSVWAVGDGGTVLHWNGAAWEPQSLPSLPDPADSVTVAAVWGTSATDVWVAANYHPYFNWGYSNLYHYDGTSWTDVVVTQSTTFAGGWSSSPTDVWISGTIGMLHYDGSDLTFDVVGREFGASLVAVTGLSANDLFAVGRDGAIEHRTASGWTAMSERYLGYLEGVFNGLWGSSPGDVWAVGKMRIGHRTGAGWTFAPSPGYTRLNAVWGSGPADVWATGDDGAMAHYDGEQWSAVSAAGVSASLNVVWGTSSTNAWAAGADGTVLHWNGTVWSASTVGTVRWNGVWGSSASDVFLVGDSGRVRRWNGSAWAPMNNSSGASLLGVWGAGPGDVYAVGEDGTVLHYDGNASGDWTLLSTPADPEAPIQAVWGSSAGDVYLLANRGLALLHWNGSAWRTVSAFARNADVRMYAIWGSGSHDIYLAGEVGTILHGQR